MRNQVFIFVLFFSTSLFSQEKSFTVSGKIAGLETDSMTLDYKNENGGRKLIKIPVKDDSFIYTGEIGAMQKITIWAKVEQTIKKMDEGAFPSKYSQLQFIAFPGAKIQFTGKVTDFIDAYPSGDVNNDDLAKLNKTIYPIMNESVNLALKIVTNEMTDFLEKEKTENKIDSLNAKVKQIKKNFIKDNPSSNVSAWLLSDLLAHREVTIEESLGLYDMMEKQKLNTNPLFIELVKRIEGLKIISIGQPAPNIVSQHTYTRKKFDLASLKGKYVVIDFWGTWCKPCISGMPKMKRYLEKYKDKMEIVGVAQESDDGTQWKKFLNKNKDYHWYQVLNRSDEDYILKYSVAGFPTKIIIDTQGKIVARFVGENDDIYNKLDEIMK